MSDREHGADVRALENQRKKPPTVRRVNVLYKLSVKYQVCNLKTLTSRFYLRDFVLPAFNLLWLIAGINLYIDLTHPAPEVAQIKDLFVEVIR